MAGFRMFALAALTLVPHAAPARQSGDELVLRAVRFYRAESLTQVKAFVQVPLVLMTSTGDGVLSYQEIGRASCRERV